MTVAKRIYLSRVIEKIDRNKSYAKKIGTKDKSTFICKKKEIKKLSN